MADSAASGSVLPIARGGRSGAMSRAAVDIFNTKVIEPNTGQPMSPDARADLAELVQMLIDSKINPARAGLGWGLAAAFAFALVVIGGLETLGRVNDIEARLDDGDRYALTVANYLVVKANDDYKNATSADQLLRALAKNQSVKTDHIPAPVQSHPPAGTARRAALYREGQGE